MTAEFISIFYQKKKRSLMLSNDEQCSVWQDTNYSYKKNARKKHVWNETHDNNSLQMAALFAKKTTITNDKYRT